VWRIALVALLLSTGIWLAIDALVQTDAERVEDEVARLVDLAREGGEGAAREILAALADDYRGSGSFSRERIEGYVRQYVLEGRPEEIATGGYIAVPKGDEILVPLLRIDVRTKRYQGSALLRVTFAERDGRFRVVNVEQWHLER
jgi:hypothetical protein